MFFGLPFAKALVNKGHEVQVLTTFPNYPSGVIFDGYKNQLLFREVMDEIPIVRVPLYPSHDVSAVRRIFSYTSFALSASTIGTFTIDKADIAYVVQGPATNGLPAFIMKILRKIPFVFDIKDLWPDSLLATGMFDNKIGLWFADKWCNFCYKTASKIIVPAPGIKTKLIERGVPKEKVEIIYNWCDDALICRSEKNEDLAESLGMAGKFNVVFAGNIGKAQAMGAVLDAAKILDNGNNNIQLVLIGGGVEVESLKQKAIELSLGNVIFHARKPVAEIGSILRLADVLLVHLRDEPLFRITIPSKTQAYLAMGRPILTGVKGDAAKLVEDAEAGLRCEPENPQNIAETIMKFYKMEKDELLQMGTNGMNYYDKHLSFKIAVQSYLDIFEQVIR